MRQRLWVLALMLTIGMSGAPAHAAILFDDSFETCMVGGGASFPCEGWDDFGQETAGTLDVTNEFPLSGSKTVRMTWADLNASGGPSIYKSFATPQEHIFIRFPTRRSAAWTYPTNGNSKLMIIGNLGYPRAMINDRYGTYQVAMECPYNIVNPTTGVKISSLFWNTGITPTGNAYDQVEMEYKLNAPGQADGLVRVWINAVLRLEKLNLELRGPDNTVAPIAGCTGNNRADYTFKTIQLFKQGGIGTRHYDRIAVGTTRVFPVGQSGSGDTTPPATPAGWEIH